MSSPQVVPELYQLVKRVMGCNYPLQQSTGSEEPNGSLGSSVTKITVDRAQLRLFSFSEGGSTHPVSCMRGFLSFKTAPEGEYLCLMEVSSHPKGNCLCPNGLKRVGDQTLVSELEKEFGSADVQHLIVYTEPSLGDPKQEGPSRQHPGVL